MKNFSPLSIRSAVILAFFAFLIVVSRLHTYDEPFEWDITAYALMGHELLHGERLYSDLWDVKPPATYVTYAAGELLVGFGPRSIFLLNVGAALITLLGVYAAASASGGVMGRRAGLWAGAFWTVLSIDPLLQANQPNAEVFMNACLIWAFAILVRAKSPRGLGRFVAVGALWGLASLYKYLTFVTSCLCALAHVWFPPEGTRDRKRAGMQAFAMLGIIALEWGAVGAYFAATGRGELFADAVFLHHREATGSLFINLWKGVMWSNLMPGFLLFLLPAFALAVTSIFWRQTEDRRYRLLFAAYLLSIPIQIALPGRFFAHYYQLWLPPLAVGLGRCLAAFAASELCSKEFRRLTGPALLIFFLLCELPYFTRPAVEWPLIKYGGLGRNFIASRDVGILADNILLPEERIFHWGYDYGLYFWSGRSQPSGVYYFGHYLHGPMAKTLNERTVDRLDAAPPELIIVSKWAMEEFKEQHPVPRWIDERYSPIPTVLETDPFRLLILKGGRLDRSFSGATVFDKSDSFVK